jgi:membrane protease YdiL (CAAX protease family)
VSTKYKDLKLRGQSLVHLAARTLLSLLLGATAIAGAVLLFRQGLLPLIDAAFQPTEQWLSATRRVGILLAALSAYWAYVRWHEKRAAVELHVLPLRTALGASLGAALVALPVAVLFALGAYEKVQFRGFAPALLGVAGLICVAAILEELAYRCLLFRVLERATGTMVALAVQALVFAIHHLANVGQGETWDLVVTLVSVTLLGLLWAGLFILTRNLWVVAANHAAWNFTILLSGVPLSGIDDWQSLAPLESRYVGPNWLTGGMFGPENSLLVMMFVAIALLVMLRSAIRSGALVPMPTWFNRKSR